MNSNSGYIKSLDDLRAIAIGWRAVVYCAFYFKTSFP
jgi:hypothetical protein